MTLRIRAKARRDLDEILDYSVAAHGEVAGETYLLAIDTHSTGCAFIPNWAWHNRILAIGFAACRCASIAFSIASTGRIFRSSACCTRRWTRRGTFDWESSRCGLRNGG